MFMLITTSASWYADCSQAKVLLLGLIPDVKLGEWYSTTRSELSMKTLLCVTNSCELDDEFNSIILSFDDRKLKKKY